MSVATDKFEPLRQAITHSVFRQNSYHTTIPFCDLANALITYINPELENCASTTDIFTYGIPGFQRENDKWSREQQVSFVENCILGFRPDLLLYTLGSLSESKILDGLQRITAIADFIEGRFKVFDGEFSFQELSDSRIICRTAMLGNLKVYTFNTELEAVNFYIKINKGITHSNEDILRAEDYLASINAPQEGQSR